MDSLLSAANLMSAWELMPPEPKSVGPASSLPFQPHWGPLDEVLRAPLMLTEDEVQQLFSWESMFATKSSPAPLPTRPYMSGRSSDKVGGSSSSFHISNATTRTSTFSGGSNNNAAPMVLSINTAVGGGDASPAEGGADSANGGAPSGFMEFVDLDRINGGQDVRTTYMIRRLPRYISVDQLRFLMTNTGLLTDSVDLIYVPVFTGKAHANRGYAFINFKNPELGALFLSIIKYSPETELSRQLGRCDVVYAHIQGKDEMLNNLSRIRDNRTPGMPGGLVEAAAWWPTAQPTLPPGLFLD